MKSQPASQNCQQDQLKASVSKSRTEKYACVPICLAGVQEFAKDQRFPDTDGVHRCVAIEFFNQTNAQSTRFRDQQAAVGEHIRTGTDHDCSGPHVPDGHFHLWTRTRSDTRRSRRVCADQGFHSYVLGGTSSLRARHSTGVGESCDDADISASCPTSDGLTAAAVFGTEVSPVSFDVPSGASACASACVSAGEGSASVRGGGTSIVGGSSESTGKKAGLLSGVAGITGVTGEPGAAGVAVPVCQLNRLLSLTPRSGISSSETDMLGATSRQPPLETNL